jgi:hypothetical protein
MLERQRDDIHDFLSSQEPESLLDAYSDSYRVPRDVMRRVMKRESGGDQGAVSRKGARGRMQLMPATARSLGVNPDDAVGNIEGGVRYFREQLDAFGDPAKAAAAYNAGPGAVRKYGGVPPYRETQAYVKAIAGGDEQGDDDIAEFLKRGGSGGDAQPPDAAGDDVGEFLGAEKSGSSSATARRYSLTPEAETHFDLSGGGAQKAVAQPVAAQPDVVRFGSAVEVETAQERAARLKRRPPLALAPTAAAAQPDDSPTGRPTPAPDATAVQNFKVRIPREEAARAETPEQREGLLVSAYVNTLPAEDRDAALVVLENLRSRKGGRLLDNVPDSFAATDSGRHVTQGFGVDAALPELIAAYKQGGPQALNRAIDGLGARRAKHAEAERQKHAEREALASAIKREGAEAGQDGQLRASGNILLNQSEQGFRKLGGNLAGVTGALAGRLGLDSVDRSLTDTYENQAAAARALDESSRLAEERSGLHPVAAEAAKGVGMLPEMVGTLALGGPTGLAVGEMVKGADEPMLETMMRAYGQAAFGAGAEAQRRGLPQARARRRGDAGLAVKPGSGGVGGARDGRAGQRPA